MIDTLRGMSPIVLLAGNAALLALAAWRVRRLMHHWLVVGAIVLLAPVAASAFAAVGGSGAPLLLGTPATAPTFGEPVRGGGMDALLSVDGLSVFVTLLALASMAVALAASAMGGDGPGWPARPVRRTVGAQLALAGCVLAASATHLALMVVGVVLQGAATWAALFDGASSRLRRGLAIGAGVLSLVLLVVGAALICSEAGTAFFASFAQPPLAGRSSSAARTMSMIFLLVGTGSWLVLPALISSRERDGERDPGRALWLGMLPAIATFGIIVRLLVVAMESPVGFGSVFDGVQWVPVFVIFAIMLMTTGHAIALMAKRLTPMIGGLALANAGLLFCALATAMSYSAGLLAPPDSELSLTCVAHIAQLLGACGFWLWIMLALLTGLVVGTTAARSLAGRDDLGAVQGLARRMPWLAVGLAMIVLAQIGVFPTAGFTGRMELLRGPMEAPRTGLVSDLETVQQLSLVVGAAFFNIALGVLVATRSGRRLMRAPLDGGAPVAAGPPSPLRRQLLGG
ncbi:MAG: hypothetical protein AB7K09_24115, partial [Planctomycetota bacterium]